VYVNGARFMQGGVQMCSFLLLLLLLPPFQQPLLLD
jgi:hypothetical protein